MTPKNIADRSDRDITRNMQGAGAVARGFGQTFGILPSMAFLTLIVDTMLFGAEAGTLGLSLPFSCAVGAVLGFITFLAQRKYYGDDNEAALIKGLILGFLTAIPTALPAMIYVPAGFVGLVHNLREEVMTGQSGFRVLCQTVDTAVEKAVATFLCEMWAAGPSVLGSIVALATAVFLLELTVLGGIVIAWAKR